MMSQLIIHAGDFTFQARFEEQLAPKTCAAFRKVMPFESQAGHGAGVAGVIWNHAESDAGVHPDAPPLRAHGSLALERHHLAKCRAGLWRQLLLKTGLEREVAGVDNELAHS